MRNTEPGLPENPEKEKNDVVEGDLVKAKKEARLEAAAKLEEMQDKNGKETIRGRAFGAVFGGRKEKAKVFRDAFKKKDVKTQVWEAVQKASEDNAPTEPVKPATPPPATPSSPPPPATP